MSAIHAAALVPTYHHGDLRHALLEAASTILEETGRWDFSLREVARRAKVSHNAPYRHFADKESLLAAVGTAGFEMLHSWSMQAAADGRHANAADRLAAMGKAYIAFGSANPALYRLMFAHALPRVDGVPDMLRRVVGTAQGMLRDVIIAGSHDGSLRVDAASAAAITAAAVAAWSQVHGLTMLMIDRLISNDEEALDDISGGVVDLFVRGLRTSPSAAGR